jgi:hypothetical protein
MPSRVQRSNLGTFPFPNPREVRFDFSPLVLATHDFVSRRLELLFPYLPSPRDTRGQRGVDSSKCVTCVQLIISRAHHVVLPHVSYVQPRHFVTSLLTTWGTQTLRFHLAKPQICEIPRSLPPILLRWTT